MVVCHTEGIVVRMFDDKLVVACSTEVVADRNNSQELDAAAVGFDIGNCLEPIELRSVFHTHFCSHR